MISVNRLRSRRNLRLVVLPLWLAASTWLVPPSVRVLAAVSAVPEGRLAKWMGVDPETETGTPESNPADDPAGRGEAESPYEVRSPASDRLIEQFADALRAQGQAVRSIPRDVEGEKGHGAPGFAGESADLEGLRTARSISQWQFSGWTPAVGRTIVCDNPQGP